MIHIILKIGHRGAMGYEPENTLRSFRKAVELNVDMVELDVHVCKTGELVVIHDDKLDRTTNGKGDVSETSFRELRKLNAGKGEKIPSLQEVLDLINKKVNINIELKGKGTAIPVFEIIETYVKEKAWSYDDFFVSSFNHYELKKFSKLNPKVKIGALIDKMPVNLAKLAENLNVFFAYSINPPVEVINQKFVDDAHKRGLKVFVWTVNGAEDIERMKQLNVDGIFSDFPDRI